MAKSKKQADEQVDVSAFTEESVPLSSGEGVFKTDIPPLVMEWTKIRITGETPLIVNRFGDNSIRQIEDNQQGRKRARGTLPPRVPIHEVIEHAFLFDCENPENSVSGSNEWAYPTNKRNEALKGISDYSLTEYLAGVKEVELE